MTITKFSRDYIPIVQTVVSLLGLVSLFLIWLQIKITSNWNKLNNPQTFLNIPVSKQLELEKNVALDKLNIPPDDLISEEGANKILNDRSAILHLKSFLNEYENLCAAIRAGSLDGNIAFAVHSARVLRTYSNYKELIKAVRTKYNDDEVYIEMEKVALAWQTIHEAKVKASQSQLQKIKDKLDKQKGMKRAGPL